VREARADVVVAGAGPVGLSLAIDLAWRGIEVAVCELRYPGEAPSVRCNHVAARTMEAFRRLGLADAVRDAGLPPDHPHDVAYRITTTGRELSRIAIPSRRERFSAREGPDTGWPTPEPPHRINQIYLEPILFAHAAALDGVRILSRTVVEGFEQDEDGVTVRARDLDARTEVHLRGRHLVGCEGARSPTRRALGATFHGDAVVQRVQSTDLRAAELVERLRAPPAWGTFSLNPRRCGMVYAIDGRERFLVHNYLDEDEAFDAVPRDASIRAILGVGQDFSYETVREEDWIGRRLVADRFRDRRVFLCGDAAHIWVPFGGYGMNAGIADAMNLSWLLAASLQGWGAPAILDAYEAERLPITDQVSRLAMGHAVELARQRRAVPAAIEAPGPEGDAARRAAGRAAYELNVQQYCAAGLNFGPFYDASPIVAHDGGVPPPYTMGSYTPSTVPGCRVPHVWLRDGRSLYDALGPGFTLLSRGADADVGRFLAAAAAAARGVPLAHVALDGDDGVYDRAFVLARPDQHVAWRGEALPPDPGALLDLVTGRQSPSR
jgi:2-polyprenyl-6-methoxyphenol hydroxylase-like FAD-dependent oxidoreductase